ncbi:MAG: acetate kinase [Oscillospiraceae bacterium]|nr:acetate kinase [Oscillospiraceae bacterium]
MKILVINAGSSSMKYQLIDMENENVIAKGLCERIGIDGKITHKTHEGKEVAVEVAFPTHKEAFDKLMELLTSGEGKVIDDVKEINAVGHRVVHGGEKFVESVVITDEVINTVDELSVLAPLHNPANLTAIKACIEVMGKDVPQVAVFDTAFHQTMPAKAYISGMPYEYYEKYGVRKYGFHGTSHRFVSSRLGEILGGLEGKKVVTCHLGNGSSIAAIKDGKCMDTTMGFTPLDGIIMGTRSGAVDNSIVSYVAEKEGLSWAEMTNILNKKSGFQGISGISSDCRDLETAAKEGNERAQLTLDKVCYQIKQYVGSYAAAMGGLDAVIFTGGIGENSASVRYNVCKDMEFLGLEVCEELCNKASRKEATFSTENSKVQAWVLPTNEELLIARDTAELVK